MKKLLTLFTLLLTVCSGAWATDYSSTPLVSADFSSMSNGTPTAIAGVTYNNATISSGKLTWSGNWDENNRDIQITFTITGTACKLVLGHVTSSSSMTIKGILYKDDTKVSNFSSSAWSISGNKTSDDKEFTSLTPGEYTLKLGPGGSSTRSVITSINIYDEAASGGDVTAPTFSLTTPATTTNVAVTSHDVVLTASENVTKVGENITGTLKVGDAAATAINYTFNEAAKTLTYTFAEDLEYVTTYAFTVDANQVQDAAENKNAKTSAFSFTTKKAPTTLKTISEAKTWDFSSNVSGSKQFTGADANTEFVYADIDGLTFTSPFDEEALAFKGEYPFRGNDNKYAQNGTLHFKTSVPGTIKVKFSDTGTKASSSAVKRYLVVNDNTTEYWTSRENNGESAYDANLNVVTDEIPVPVGDVTIKGTSAIIVSKIVFTPTADAITVTTAGLATYASNYNLDFSEVTGIKAYRASISDKTITFNKVDKVPTGEGMLIRAMSNLDETTTFYVPHTESASPIDNAMKRGEGTAVAYQPTVPTYRAYLQSTAALAKGFVINYDDEEGEETDGIKAVSTKVENGVRYNLAGQKVGADYKGIVIVNGKKVIIK